jgi:hypothetical protein
MSSDLPRAIEELARHYPLAEVPGVMHHLEAGQAMGKIVITIWPQPLQDRDERMAASSTPVLPAGIEPTRGPIGVRRLIREQGGPADRRAPGVRVDHRMRDWDQLKADEGFENDGPHKELTPRSIEGGSP